MISAQLRDAAMVVDLKALKHNIKQQQAALPAGSRILAVVKADAYGHGAVPVAHAAKEAGVDGFCVAMLDEGLELRNAGIDQLMLVLGLTPVHYAPVAALNDISLTVGSVNWLKEYAELAKNESLPPLKVHLALDTGMGRIGFRDAAELKQALALVNQPAFVFEGMFTHFATADAADDTYFKRQLGRWHDFLAAVDQKPPYVHMANSAVGMWHRETIAANTVRSASTPVRPHSSPRPSPPPAAPSPSPRKAATRFRLTPSCPSWAWASSRAIPWSSTYRAPTTKPWQTTC